VWAEVELPDDFDWQSEALKRASLSKSGDIIAKTAHITDQIPERGNYRYKTNPNMRGSWLISGEMRVNKRLSREEQKSLEEDLGFNDLPSLPEVIKNKKLSLEDLTAAAVKELREFYPDVFKRLSKKSSRYTKYEGGKVLSSLQRNVK